MKQCRSEGWCGRGLACADGGRGGLRWEILSRDSGGHDEGAKQLGYNGYNHNIEQLRNNILDIAPLQCHFARTKVCQIAFRDPIRFVFNMFCIFWFVPLSQHLIGELSREALLKEASLRLGRQPA